jgi:N,N'-diacetylchitobiose phosphorylase
VFVPIDKPVEVWDIEIENTSGEERDLSLFTYAEWCFWDMNNDLTNFQYILYTCRMNKIDDIIDYSILLWPLNSPKGFLASSLPVTSYDTDRDVFIGKYRSESNPISVENGKCSNSVALGGNPCASVQNSIKLKPGEKKRLYYIIGIGDAKTYGIECKNYYKDIKNIEKDFEEVKDYWNKRLGNFSCNTPSDHVNSMVNIWNQYQCQTTFNWSRSASFNEAGGRDGLGYRDTNQDTLGVLHSIPHLVKNKLIDLLKGQISDGFAMHGFQPLEWKQGSHNIPKREHIFSDDHLWLLLSIPQYIKESGDYKFLDEEVPYCDKEIDTVYEHLKRALDFSYNNRGPHGLLLGLAADWNDCINLKGNGESIWSTFLFCTGIKEFIQLAKRFKKPEKDIKFYTEYLNEFEKIINEYTWDGEWFLRGYLDSGEKLGGKDSRQSKIFINSQTWSVIANVFSKEKQEEAMNSLNKYLATEHGIVKNYPAYREPIEEVGAITSFPPGLKENAGIFCHANTWAIIAECILGRGDRAFEYYMSFLPASKNDIADKYTMEPYVYSQFITGKEHPFNFGRARNSWLTGTASWSFVAISQYILGVRADYDGLIVNPCIPKKWDEFSVKRVFRNKTINIKVMNPKNISKGIQSLVLNGEKIEGKLLKIEKLKEDNILEVIMG